MMSEANSELLLLFLSSRKY